MIIQLQEAAAVAAEAAALFALERREARGRENRS